MLASEVSLQSPFCTWKGSILAKSTRMPSTERSVVLAIYPRNMAATSASIKPLEMPNRSRRRATSRARRSGSYFISRAGNTMGSNERDLNKIRSGFRSTTTRLTYQSPSAVSERNSPSAERGRVFSSFRVGLSMTIGTGRTNNSCVYSNSRGVTEELSLRQTKKLL